MNVKTRALYDRMLDGIARLNGVSSAVIQFTVEPSIQQTLESKIQESSDFLKDINIVPVDELKGSVLGLGITQTIASRTNTAANGSEGRKTVDPTGLDERTYECVKINSDTHLTYAKLDMWAKFTDFETRVRDAIVQRQGLDRLLIGFNGRSAAANTDRDANPLLQDVAIGWIHHVRLEKPAAVMGSTTVAGVVTDGVVRVGPGGDYLNLDACAYDAVQLLDVHHRTRTDLVVVCGHNLLHDKYFPVINADNKPSETLAGQTVIAQKRIGGFPAVSVPGIPADTMILTTKKNLSIYYQDGKRRRRIFDNAKFDRVEDYQSSNDAFVVEDLGLIAIVENIEFVTAETEGNS